MPQNIQGLSRIHGTAHTFGTVTGKVDDPASSHRSNSTCLGWSSTSISVFLELRIQLLLFTHSAISIYAFRFTRPARGMISLFVFAFLVLGGVADEVPQWQQLCATVWGNNPDTTLQPEDFYCTSIVQSRLLAAGDAINGGDFANHVTCLARIGPNCTPAQGEPFNPTLTCEWCAFTGAPSGFGPGSCRIPALNADCPNLPDLLFTPWQATDLSVLLPQQVAACLSRTEQQCNDAECSFCRLENTADVYGIRMGSRTDSSVCLPAIWFGQDDDTNACTDLQNPPRGSYNFFPERTTTSTTSSTQTTSDATSATKVLGLVGTAVVASALLI